MISKPDSASVNQTMAYLVIAGQREKEYLGGIMVVDRRGLPLEFHYSEKVNPTKIQEILYGNVLERFIKENVLCENLFQALKTKPDLLILDERELELSGEVFSSPVVYLEKTKVKPLKEVSLNERLNEESVLFQARRYEHPLLVRFYNSNPEEQKKALAVISNISETMDVLEPISRIKEALKQVEKELGGADNHDG